MNKQYRASPRPPPHFHANVHMAAQPNVTVLTQALTDAANEVTLVPNMPNIQGQLQNIQAQLQAIQDQQEANQQANQQLWNQRFDQL